jgi:hypothetical protein
MSFPNVQRVRIGLTGLAFVFILVLLATILVRPSAESPVTLNGAAVNGKVDNKADPQEPLAELGVAPGNADSNGAKAVTGTSPATR